MFLSLPTLNATAAPPHIRDVTFFQLSAPIAHEDVTPAYCGAERIEHIFPLRNHFRAFVNEARKTTLETRCGRSGRRIFQDVGQASRYTQMLAKKERKKERSWGASLGGSFRPASP